MCHQPRSKSQTETEAQNMETRIERSKKRGSSAGGQNRMKGLEH